MSQPILEHTLDEIKQFNSKVYCPVAKLHNLNRYLVDIANETDDHMRNYLVDRYQHSLDLYHINGRTGSLIPQEDTTATSTNDPITKLSLLLKDLPIDFEISRFSGPEGGYSVTLHSMIDAICSEPTTGTGTTFAQAYTQAINKMKRQALVSIIDETAHPIEAVQS